jgi:hypothetical protein
MVDSLTAVALENLLSPPILFFILGGVAGLLKSDLEIPEILAKFLALYLVAAIGLKGGMKLAEHGLNGHLLLLFLTAIFVSALLPFLGFWLLRMTTSLSTLDAGALAAHYGSVSLVTFITCGEFLGKLGLTYPGYMVALLSVMETPAILSGIYLCTVWNRTEKHVKTWLVIREVFLNGTVVLLLGALLIGYYATPRALHEMKPFFVAPFKGLLCFFLLDMGLIIGRRAGVAHKLSWPLALFGIYMPLMGAGVGFITGSLFALSIPETLMLMTLFASASYIAVPAAIKLAVPNANPTLYLSLPLGVTFPFNIILGIPLYYFLILWARGGL